MSTLRETSGRIAHAEPPASGWVRPTCDEGFTVLLPDGPLEFGTIRNGSGNFRLAAPYDHLAEAVLFEVDAQSVPGYGSRPARVQVGPGDICVIELDCRPSLPELRLPYDFVADAWTASGAQVKELTPLYTDIAFHWTPTFEAIVRRPAIKPAECKKRPMPLGSGIVVLYQQELDCLDSRAIRDLAESRVIDTIEAITALERKRKRSGWFRR